MSARTLREEYIGWKKEWAGRTGMLPGSTITSMTSFALDNGWIDQVLYKRFWLAYGVEIVALLAVVLVRGNNSPFLVLLLFCLMIATSLLLEIYLWSKSKLAFIANLVLFLLPLACAIGVAEYLYVP